MIELTKKQRELVRHAIGLDGRSKTTYRNHFVIGPGGDGYEDWMDLVKRGLAHRKSGEQMGALSGNTDTFWCTRELALAVRRHNEHLSRDFRE